MSKFFVLILLTLHTVRSRTIDRCQFAEELIKNYNLTVAETKKHLCIVINSSSGNILNTANKLENYNGIYRISTKWWCGKDGRNGGGCDIKCENLIDDDIADDVKCARKILLGQGIEGWSLNQKQCKNSLTEFLQKCTLNDFNENRDATPTSTTTTYEVTSSIAETTIQETKIPITTTSKIPEIVTQLTHYKVKPNLLFNVYNFNITGQNYKIEYEI